MTAATVGNLDVGGMLKLIASSNAMNVTKRNFNAVDDQYLTDYYTD